MYFDYQNTLKMVVKIKHDLMSDTGTSELMSMNSMKFTCQVSQGGVCLLTQKS